MSISVIIPYYNESETILLTLLSIESQDRQPDEVLLIDSGSTDNTSDIISKWIKSQQYKNAHVNFHKVIESRQIITASVFTKPQNYSSNQQVCRNQTKEKNVFIPLHYTYNHKLYLVKPIFLYISNVYVKIMPHR